MIHSPVFTTHLIAAIKKMYVYIFLQLPVAILIDQFPNRQLNIIVALLVCMHEHLLADCPHSFYGVRTYVRKAVDGRRSSRCGSTSHSQLAPWAQLFSIALSIINSNIKNVFITLHITSEPKLNLIMRENQPVNFYFCYYPRFRFTSKSGTAFPKTGVRLLLWTTKIK